MEYKELLDAVTEYINEKLPDATAKIISTVKNNGVKLCGVSICKDGMNIAPAIYMENFYLDYINGADVEEIAEKVIGIYENYMPTEDIDVDFFADYESIKNQLFIKLINTKRNEELLENVPHEPFMDLSIVVYCKVYNKEIGNGFILVKNEHLEMWNIEKDCLFKNAMDNTEKSDTMKIRSIVEVLKEVEPMMCEELDGLEEENSPQLNVVTSNDGYYGAAFMAIPNKLKEMEESMAGDFYIIPSSVHELLILPKGHGDLEGLGKMINEVNETAVKREEVLSDHAYYFSVKDGISM